MEHGKESIEDEDISIDFGKIKNIFGKKKGKESEEKREEIKEGEIGIKKERPELKPKIKEDEEKEKEEEISLNLSRIKGVFKKREKVAEDIEKEEEISFDIKKIGHIFNKNKYIILPVILILTAMFFSIYIRTEPIYLPIVDEWAENSVKDYFRSQIRAEVDKQYPNLPDSNKQVLVDREFNKFLEENKEGVKQQITSTADFFKSELKDESGHTYSGDIDPYFWMRHARNVLENGHPGDIIKDGVQWDNRMYAPLGRPVPFDMFHAYFLAYMFKVIHLFNPESTIMDTASYAAIFLIALSIIPAFFITRRIAGDLGGFIAALIVAVHPSLIARTSWGDTDAHNVFFPLYITWFFLIAFETRDIKKRVGFTLVSSFLIGLYSFTWGGWWYIFDFLLVTAVLYFVYYIILHRNELKDLKSLVRTPAIRDTLLLTVIFFVFSGVFVGLFIDIPQFSTAWNNPMGFARMKEVAITTVWPNVFTTVAEQNPASLREVINSLGMGGRSGGRFFLMIAIIGVILTLFKKDAHGKTDIKYTILLTLWMVATIYASTKGIRYVLLVVPAFGVAFGAAFGIVYQFIVKWASKELHVNKMIISTVLIAVIFFAFLINPVKGGIEVGKQDIPMMNDAWYNSLDKINREAAPDAIINSWWDYGHWFKFIADRPVTFDGTSQNSPQAHWIGNVLVTDNENEAVGILRMLDCGANTAEENLDKIIKDEAHSVEIIYDIIIMDKERAIEELRKHGLNEEEIKSVVDYTHCEPPENYFITSDDMVEKSGVWGHFGSWNFDKATIYFKLQKEEYKGKEAAIKYLQERFNYSGEEAENVYLDVKSLGSGGGRGVNDWIAPWPGYVSGLSGCDRVAEDVIVCSIIQGGQAKINLTTMEVDIPTPQGIVHPNSVSYVSGDDVLEKIFTENTIGYSMALIPSGDSFQALMMSPQLAKGMFTRLYYFKGHGLEHFKLFSFERSPVGGATIYVWKVDWQGGEKNIVDEFMPKEEEAVEQTAEEQQTEENITKNVSEENSS